MTDKTEAGSNPDNLPVNPNARKTPATRVGDPTLYQSVNELSMQVIKSVFIANGGGVLVLLAFFGSVWNADANDPAPIIVALAPAIGAYLLGVAFSILAGFVAYLSVQTWTNYHFSGQDELPKYGNLSNTVAVFMGIASLIFFVVGSWIAAISFASVT